MSEVSGGTMAFSLYVPGYKLSPVDKGNLGGLEDGLCLTEIISYVPSSSRHLLLEILWSAHSVLALC